MENLKVPAFEFENEVEEDEMPKYKDTTAPEELPDTPPPPYIDP